MKTYSFDTFGNPLPAQPAANGHGQVNVTAATFLSSGAIFDPALAAYDLRATRYHPAAGRFTRVEPYAGAVQAPPHARGNEGQAEGALPPS